MIFLSDLNDLFEYEIKIFLFLALLCGTLGTSYMNILHIGNLIGRRYSVYLIEGKIIGYVENR